MTIVVGALVLLAWIPLLVGGIVLNGLAGALYVGAHLGPGPRDGLWVAIGHLNQFFLHRVQVRVPIADEPVTAPEPAAETSN